MRPARLLASARALAGSAPTAEEQQFSTPQKQALRRFWWEGLFGESSEIVWFQYFTVYALSVGAGAGLIGVLVASGSLVSALATWPGAWLAERTRQYRLVVVLSNGFGVKTCFLMLALLPWLLDGAGALVLLTLVSLARGFLASLQVPAWHGFVADTVPRSIRGRYFASRNFGRQLISLTFTPAIGLAIGRFDGLLGWQLTWFAAFLLGMVATAIFLTIPQLGGASSPASAAAPPERAPGRLVGALGDRGLLAFVATSGLFQLAVTVAAPFFSVYLVQQLGGSPFWVGLTATASPISALVCQPLLGRLADGWGAKHLLVASNALIPVLPLGWVLASEPWHILLVNLLGGGLWAGSHLAAFNLLLAIAPADKLPRYSAAYQSAQFLCGFAGPLLGGLVIPFFGFQALFLLSAVGRLVAAALQLALIPDDREPEPSVERTPLPLALLKRAVGI